MNAADVLADSRFSSGPAMRALAPEFVAALLAHGGQGVAILPDGTLWALDDCGWFKLGRGDTRLYRLRPLSAEAGDTQRCQWRPTPKSVHQCELPEGHEGHHRAVATQRTGWSAEAGDTDD